MRLRTRPSPHQTEALTGPAPRGWSGDFQDQSAALDRYNSLSRSTLGEVIPVETMQDVLTPNYHQKLRAGEFLPPNPMTRSQNTDSVLNVIYGVGGVGRFTTNPTDKRWRASSFVGHMALKSPITKSLFTTADINAIAIEAKARLSSQGMDYLTSLVELRQTIAMFTSFRANLMSRIQRLAREFSRKHKRRKFNSEREAWDAFSAFWLEARFGWRILYYDIMSLQNYIETMNEEKAIISASSRQSKDRTEFTRTYTQGYTSQFHGAIRCFREDIIDEQVSVGYAGRLDFSKMGNPNVLNTLWDIIPFSLVVDMFFNVQANILAFSSQDFNVESISNSGWISRKRTGRVDVNFQHLPNGTFEVAKLDIITLTSGTGLQQYVSRQPFGDPKLSISFRPNVSGLKIIDLATLVLPLGRTIRNLLK